jgi:hypothetical protein|tara:strand:+ start:161 stop:388 length:228 start_codon:yes stop_codon:yes gene_type:complete
MVTLKLSRDDLVRLNSGKPVSVYCELGLILLTSCVSSHSESSTMTETNMYQQITPTKENIKQVGELFKSAFGGLK